MMQRERRARSATEASSAASATTIGVSSGAPISERTAARARKDRLVADRASDERLAAEILHARDLRTQPALPARIKRNIFGPQAEHASAALPRQHRGVPGELPTAHQAVALANSRELSLDHVLSPIRKKQFEPYRLP